jgi:hypothetical protein
VERAERGSAVVEGAGREPEGGRRPVGRRFGPAAELLAAGDLAAGREAEPGGELFLGGPARHVDPDFSHDFQGRGGIDAIEAGERHPLPLAWKRLMLVSYRWAAAIVTPNRETREWFPLGLRARTHVIPNPISASPAPPSVDDGRPGGLVVSIGRLSEEKGHDRLLEAFARVSAERPGW